MACLGLHVDDASYAIASDGVLLDCRPSLVDNGSAGNGSLGDDAQSLLREAPERVSSDHWQSLQLGNGDDDANNMLLASELRRRLASYGGSDDQYVVAVPARFDIAPLGVIPGLFAALELPEPQLCDAAALSAAASGVQGAAIVLEVGLHHVAASLVETGAAARRLRSVTVEGIGLIRMQELWLECIAASMVRQTRFDPLHHGQLEQQLYDALPRVLERLAHGQLAQVQLSSQGRAFTARIAAADLQYAAAPLYERVQQVLAELGAVSDVSLLLPRHCEHWPGFPVAIAAVCAGRMALLPQGVAAMAASRQAVAGSGLALALAVPTLAEPVFAPAWTPIRSATPATPTAIAINGQRFELAAEHRTLGREGCDIPLPANAQGVSRHHCTIEADGDRHYLVDHSRHGSFHNGQRVAKRTPLHAGDLLRIGSPPIYAQFLAGD
ncbi:MAG: FHA domain-containing protein [Steroidobacteraceae bacterium]